MRRDVPRVAGILLTGGASRRLGVDKARLEVGGEVLAGRSARVLGAVATPVIEVGPGASGLAWVREEPPGQGPLGAICAGQAWLLKGGHHGDALVVACDVPRLSESVLALLARWPTPGTVVPVVEGRPQPLCARWGAADLCDAIDRFARGERSVRHLAGLDSTVLLDESVWGAVAGADSFEDLDSPADAARLGIDLGARDRG